MITYPTNKLQKVLLGGGCEQRNLPNGHQQVEYLVCNGTQYIDTEYYPNNNTTFKTKLYVTNIPSTAVGSRWSLSPTFDTFGAIIDSTGNLVCYYGTYSDNEYITIPDISLNTKHTVEINLNSVVLDSTSYPITRNTFTSPYSMYIGAVNNIGTPGENSMLKGRIYPLEVRENGILVHNYIPDKHNNVLGMYDTVTGDFLTNAGTGDFTAGPDVVPTPDAPIDIVCNNGVLKLTKWNQIMRNFTSPLRINVDNSGGSNNVYRDIGLSINSTKLTTRHKLYINVDYTINTAYSEPSIFLYIYNYQSASNLHILPRPSLNKAAGRYKYRTIESDAKTSYTPSEIRFYLALGPGNRIDISIHAINIIDLTEIYGAGNEPATVTAFEADYKAKFGKAFDYEAYNAGYDRVYAEGTNEVITDNLGNTANGVNLLAVGKYKDTQSVLDGKVTRNVGVKVLDGTENWELTSSTSSGIIYSLAMTDCGSISDWSVRTGNCTHFNNYIGTTTPDYGSAPLYSYWQNKQGAYFRFKTDVSYSDVNIFKAWLAEQYNAGTPVIIVYPLATSTTEQVTPQPLAGNTATVTAGSIDNLPIESSTIAELKKRYIGDNEVKRVYIGSNLVWSAE